MKILILGKLLFVRCSEKYWGNGYVGEALSALIEYTFKYTDFSKLEAYHRDANSKSGRVLEKSSMSRTDTVRRFILLNEEPLGEKCYAITKEDYFVNVKPFRLN